MMTEWFPTDIAPAYAGCYITRRPTSDCQHFMRWCTKTEMWYSAGSMGKDRKDVIWNSGGYEWRGLKEQA